MANQQSFTSQDIDRMKSDAIRRARQMQSRATIQSSTPETKGSDQQPSNAPVTTANSGTKGFSKLPFLSGFNDIIRNLGLSSEQLIIFAIILMLCENKDNRMLIMALIYIAL